MTPAQLRREAQAHSTDEYISYLETSLLELRDAAAAVLCKLRASVHDEICVLVGSIPLVEFRGLIDCLPSMPGSCRLCGCTQESACYDPATGQGCHWSEPGLCSVCAGVLKMQQEASKYLQEHPGDRGARLGASDAVAEECLIRLRAAAARAHAD